LLGIKIEGFGKWSGIIGVGGLGGCEEVATSLLLLHWRTEDLNQINRLLLFPSALVLVSLAKVFLFRDWTC